MSDVVERARTALEGVTRGPWQLELVDGKPVEHQHYQYDSMDEWYDVDGPNDGWLAHCQDVADARFIAAARSLVPELVAEVERLRQQRTIETTAELDALPPGAVVLGENGHAYENCPAIGLGRQRPWLEAGNSSPESSESIPLPATVLWLPEWGNA